MERDPAGELSTTYRLTIFVGAVFFILITVELGRLQWASHRNREVSVLEEKIAERATAVDAALKAATDHVNVMKRAAEASLATEAPQPSASPLLDQLRTDPGGASYSLDHLAPADPKTVGNLLGLGAIEGRDADYLAEVDLALRLFKVQSATHEVASHLAYSYYRSAREFRAIYPWVSSSDIVRASEASDIQQVVRLARAEEAWISGTPAENPERLPYWTQPYVDAAGKGLVVTYAAPIDRGDRFVGIVATDIALRALRQRLLEKPTRPGARLMVVSNRLKVLADSRGETLADGSAPEVGDLLPEELRGASLRLYGRSEGSSELINGYRVMIEPLQHAPCALVCVVADPALATGLLRRSAPYIVFIVGLAIFFTFIHVLIRNQFIRPALALVDHIRTEAKQGPTPIPRVPGAWTRWFKEISDTLPLKAVAANVPGAVYQVVRRRDGSVKIIFISAGVGDLIGIDPDEAINGPTDALDFIVEDDRAAMMEAHEHSARDMASLEHECRLRTVSGGEKWARFVAQPREGDPGEIVWDGLVLDVTERKHAEQERERLIGELQDAIAQIKTLRGLLPICANCKRIRDDSGYWSQIESYVREHSDAEFTHSICPECAKELYPGFTDEEAE